MTNCISWCNGPTPNSFVNINEIHLCQYCEATIAYTNSDLVWVKPLSNGVFLQQQIALGVTIEIGSNYVAEKSLAVTVKGAKFVSRFGVKTAGNWFNESSTALARRLGRDGETAAGITKTYERFRSYFNPQKYRIPDELNHVAKTLTEVKNTKKLAFTFQLQDYMYYCIDNCYDFTLKVRRNTRISGPLRKAIDSGYIILGYLP